IELRSDYGVKDRRQFPRAREAYYRSGVQMNRGNCVILNRRVRHTQRLALTITTTLNGINFGPIEHPERKIDQMDSEIDDTPASRKFARVAPILIGSIGVVKSEIRGVNTSKRAVASIVTHLRNRI